MLKTAIKALLGSRHKREAKKLQPLIDEINEEFNIVLPDEQIGKLNGTFDSLLRCVVSIKNHTEPSPVNGA